MYTKMKFVAKSHYEKFNETDALHIIVKAPISPTYETPTTYTAKTRNSDLCYPGHARGVSQLLMEDDGNGVDVFNPENSTRVRFNYSELAALKVLLAVEDKLTGVTHEVKMKSIKPKGAKVAYKGDPDDYKLIVTADKAKLDAIGADTEQYDPCYGCWGTYCNVCKFNDE